MAQVFASPTQYVDKFGIVETGRLLTRDDTISDSTADTLAGYTSAMYSGGNLISAVSDKLADVIEEAQSIVVGYIRKYTGFPLKVDGFELSTAEVKSKANLIWNITLDVARFILHDEDVNGRIQTIYDNAIIQAMMIGDGEVDIDGIDNRFDAITLYNI